MGTKKHKQQAFKSFNTGVLTISTSRNLSEDISGMWLVKELKKEGHTLAFHDLVPDDKEIISCKIKDIDRLYNPDVILITGGTGISSTDITIEAVKPFFDKELTGFSSIFAYLSFKQIDSAAILSRACAGIMGKTVIFCMPGSLKACKLAARELIFPEAGHILKHIND